MSPAPSLLSRLRPAGTLSDAATAAALGLALAWLGGGLPLASAAAGLLLVLALCIRILDTDRVTGLWLLIPLPLWAWWSAPEWSARPEAWVYVGVAAAFGLGATARRTSLTAGTVGAVVAVGLVFAAWQAWVHPGWLPWGREQVPQYWGRASGLFGNPNQWAAVLVLLLPLAFGAMRDAARPLLVRIGAAYLVLGMTVALLLTQSRGGLLALAAVLAIQVLLRFRRWMVLPAVALGVGLVAGVAPVRERLLGLVSTGEPARAVLWQAGVDLGSHTPWFGLGLGGFVREFEAVRPAGFFDRAGWIHSEPLQLWVDLGWLGVALVLVAALPLVARRRAVLPLATSPLGLGLFSFAVASLVDFHLHLPGSGWLAAWLAGRLWAGKKAVTEPLLQTGVSTRWAVATLAVLTAVAAWGQLRFARVDRVLRAQSREWVTHLGTLPQAQASVELLNQQVSELEVWADREPQAWPLFSELARLHAARARLGVPRREAGLQGEVAARRALSLAPDRFETHLWLGVSLGVGGKQTEAGEAFQEALKRAPRSALVWYQFGYYLAQQKGARGLALGAIENSLHLDPNYADAQALHHRLSSEQ